MEILQPQGDEDLYGRVRAKNPTHAVKVMPATEALMKRSFVSLSNDNRVDQRNVYALPKVGTNARQSDGSSLLEEHKEQ